MGHSAADFSLNARGKRYHDSILQCHFRGVLWQMKS
jgi:hypothetical protein